MTYMNAAMDFKFSNRVYLLIEPQVGVLVSYYTTNGLLPKPPNTIDFGMNLLFGRRFTNLLVEIGTYQGLIPVLNIKGTSVRNIHNAHAKITFGCYIF